MNDLRWILLVAGVALIAGLYLWGMRSRWQGRGDADTSRRPAVFTGGATGFESSIDDAADDLHEPAVLRAETRPDRRIEPGFDDLQAVDVDEIDLRLEDFDESPDDDELEALASGKREPTYSAAQADDSLPSRQEPTLRPEPAINTRPDRVEPVVAQEPAVAKPRRPQKIVAIRVSVPTPSATFAGADLLIALRSEGLGFGRYEIFHRLHDDGRPIFSVASLREPGTFDLEAMPTTQYPGVAMFAVLPGPVPAGDAFDDMIFTARALATHLNGALADERGAMLTAQRVGKLREETLEFERASGTD